MTGGRFETAEKVFFRKKLKIFGVLKCIIKQEMGLRSNSGGPFFYDYIDVLKKWTFSVISNRPHVISDDACHLIVRFAFLSDCFFHTFYNISSFKTCWFIGYNKG